MYIGKPEENFDCPLDLLYVSKKAWVHICTEICTDGIVNGHKMMGIMSVGARLSTFVFRRY